MMAPGGRFYWLVVPLLMSGCVPVLSVNDDEIDWKFRRFRRMGALISVGNTTHLKAGNIPQEANCFIG